MSYGLLIQDDQNKLILDGSKIITSWSDTMEQNIDSDHPVDFYFDLPPAIATKNNIIYFMLSLKWVGYRMHNSVSSDENLEIEESDPHSHNKSGDTSKTDAEGALEQVTDTSGTLHGNFLDFNEPHHTTHSVTDVYHKLPSHTHLVTVNLNFTDGRHTHVIGQHSHINLPQTSIIDFSTSDQFTLKLNNTTLLNNIPISNINAYKKYDNFNYNILNINNRNTINIKLNTIDCFNRVFLLYYIQCYVEY